MSKIVYMFGAGASKDCLPIIKQFPERIKNQIEFLNNENCRFDASYFDVTTKITRADALKELIADLEWIQVESMRHTSLDAFAKKLFHRDKTSDDLDRLKIALSVFLLIEQLRNSHDSRYDTFYASILTKDAWTFPKNVRILSWNYDFQFEFAYKSYTGDSHIDNGYLRTITKFEQYNSNIKNEFAIYKLNGTTELFDGRRRYHYLNTFNKGLDHSVIEEITRNFTAGRYCKNRIYPTLSFAWEEETLGKNIVNKAIEDIKDAETLVVIGYSFPDFNRDIDRVLIESMKNLKKVYIQSPNADEIVESLEQVTDSIQSLNLFLHKGVNKFLIPREIILD